MALTLAILACRTPIGPELRPVTGEQERVQAWLLRAREEAQGRTGVRAIGRMRISGPDGSGRVKQVIIAQRPRRLRLESLNFLGQTASVLVTDGENYAFYDGKDVQRGDVSPDLLRDYAGLDVDPEEAVALLVASPRLPAGSPSAVFGRGAERVALYESGRVHFSPEGELIAIEALDPGGRVRWRAEYSRWREVAGGRYPYQIVFDFPMSQVRAELELQDVEVNPPLDKSLFSLLLEGRE